MGPNRRHQEWKLCGQKDIANGKAAFLAQFSESLIWEGTLYYHITLPDYAYYMQNALRLVERH